MKNFAALFIGSIIGVFYFGEVLSAVSVGIFTLLIYRILFESNKQFVFREWALLLYCLNYLIAPAITYIQPEELVQYGMKVPLDQYFNLALPGFLFFTLGLIIIPTKIFRVDYSKVDQSAIVNKDFLMKVVVVGVLLRVTSSIFPGEIGFVIYLIAMVRFVAAFALFSLSKRLWYYSAIVLSLELLYALVAGMYHDAVMWIIFFALYFIYANKPSIQIKLIGASSLILLVLLIQAIKFTYREAAWQDASKQNLSTATSIASEKATSDVLLGEENLLSTLNRGNQAWIFASTVDNLDRTKNFQGLTNVNKYLEAALLPRFLAPDKLSSGNKEIFNEFSGHVINEGTSMGLGIFADGYIAYGAWGVYIFGFALGLIFALTFKLVERWSKISPFYVLLLLPLLNYAVRPDCELQTAINHLFKGVLLYGFLVYLTRKRFTLDSQENQRKLLYLNLAKSK
jgi:hypothetical protein